MTHGAIAGAIALGVRYGKNGDVGHAVPREIRIGFRRPERRRDRKARSLQERGQPARERERAPDLKGARRPAKGDRRELFQGREGEGSGWGRLMMTVVIPVPTMAG